MAEFNATCSWEIFNGRELKDVIYLVQSCEAEFDVLDVIAANNCLHIKKLNDNERTLELTFAPPKDTEIVQISVICEARHIEIYSHHDEYVTTADSTLIDADFDDFAAYRTEIILSKPLTACKLKFVSLRFNDSMWLYGISFHIRPNYHASSSDGLTKMSEVVTKLQKEGLPMSDGAKRLAKMLQNHDTTTNSQSSFLSVFMNMMNHVKASNVSSGQGVESKIIVNEDSKEEIKNNPKEELKDSSNNHKEEEIKDNSNNPKEETTNRYDNLSIIKPLVDKSMKQLEDKLWEKIKNHLDLQEERYMRKLDQIIDRLEFKNSPLQ
ncbi:hypothetical protein CHUAL_010079 [Chamberlinius hualienensis]